MTAAGKSDGAGKRIVVVGAGGLTADDAQQLDSSRVGEKARGLLELPAAWVPPFFVIDGAANPSIDQLRAAADIAGIPAGTSVYVRSSGVREGIDARGSLDSSVTLLEEVPATLNRLRNEQQANGTGNGAGSPVHWIVQMWIKPRAKGHLSNERRISEKARDWAAEFEAMGGVASESASVAVRKWRDGSASVDVIDCDLRANIPRALRAVAAWCGNRRAHLEWVWDGGRIWVVQLDYVSPVAGVNPRELVSTHSRASVEIEGLSAFRAATHDDLAAYRKLANAHLYTKLGYRLPDFYVTDDSALLSRVMQGDVPADFVNDLAMLCKEPLVLRTDGLNLPPERRQMLPRSDEIRDPQDAVDCLQGKFREKLQEVDVVDAKIALIGHHYIPAAASAWCLAYPDRRRVRIEALWGIPEGLYYYPHDVFDVDTGHPDVTSTSMESARVVGRRIRHKGKFIAPDEQGRWVIHTAAEGPDWAPSISKEASLKEIAVTSRRIAEAEGKPVVVMWFIDMPRGHSAHDVLPWYHEEWTETQSNTFRAAPRRLTQSREVRVLKNARDLETLLEDSARGVHVGCVAVEPEDGDIVRERSFIERLAADAKARGYEVQLRGGVLSHVFYALARHGCAVSCVDLFEQDEETINYNKLVRDGIPEGIVGKGEDVEVVRLVGEARLVSLKRKLIEEALEVTDAFDADAISDEVADVLEVVEAILSTLGVSREDVQRRKAQKRKRRGGFDRGLMLIRTHLPPPVTEHLPDQELHRTIARQEDLPISPVTIHLDKRTSTQGVSERQVTLDVPIAARAGSVKGHALDLSTPQGHQHPMRIEAAVMRLGSDMRVRLRIMNEALQLGLFDEPITGGETEPD